MKDYYKILGVSHNASKEDIKRAYRKLAHEYHPDKHHGSEKRKEVEQRFKEINEAYQVLANEERRKQYDMFGSAGQQAGNAPGWDFGNFDPRNFSGFANVDMGDIFGDIFGFGGARQTERRGRDISIDIEIPFEDSVFGTERRVLIRKQALCAACGGTGAHEGSKEITCSKCGGSGTIRTTQRSFLGTFSQLIECKICRGSGRVPEKPCKICRGGGVTPQSEEAHIVIPPGIRSGEVIRLSGKGEAIAKGGAGDLYVKVRVLPHKVFTRENDDIHMPILVPLSEALVGSERHVATLDGKMKIKVPAGTQTGDMLRIRGKGFLKSDGGSRGDLLIDVTVAMPKRVTKKLYQIAEEMKKEGL